MFQPVNNARRLQRGEGLPALLILGTCVAAWFTHLFTCFSDERWGFLIAGAIFFPIAIVHGIGIWFGLW